MRPRTRVENGEGYHLGFERYFALLRLVVRVATAVVGAILGQDRRSSRTISRTRSGRSARLPENPGKAVTSVRTGGIQESPGSVESAHPPSPAPGTVKPEVPSPAADGAGEEVPVSPAALAHGPDPADDSGNLCPAGGNDGIGMDFTAVLVRPGSPPQVESNATAAPSRGDDQLPAETESESEPDRIPPASPTTPDEGPPQPEESAAPSGPAAPVVESSPVASCPIENAGRDGLSTESTERGHRTVTVTRPHPGAGKTASIPAEHRGGGAFPREAGDGRGAVVRTRQKREPRLVCREVGPVWRLSVEVPEDIAELASIRAMQGGRELEQEFDEETSRWSLANLSDEVVLEWTPCEDDGPSTATVTPPEPLIFKLSKESGCRSGRMVRSLSSGSYLIVLHESAGSVTIGEGTCYPEEVSIEGYRAFVIHTGRGEPVRLEGPGSRRPTLPICQWPFSLSGERIPDTSDKGPLFVGEPPVLETPDAGNWDCVGKVVVGLEGRGRGKWRDWFVPEAGAKRQPLPSHIRTLRAGWFFVRIYDRQDQLLDSLDFRYLRDLEAIEIVPDPFIPGTDGHRPVDVVFRHPGILFVEADDEVTGFLSVESRPDASVATVPADPQITAIGWRLGPPDPDGPRAEVRVEIPRLWWAFAPEGEDAGPQWSATPLQASRADFRASSTRRLLIRVPGRRDGVDVRAGFSREAAQDPGRNDRDEIILPLSNFAGSAEVEELNDVEFCLWVARGDGVTERVPVLYSPAVRVCRFCGEHLPCDRDAAQHLQREHCTEAFPFVEYEELARRNRSLPAKIYRCRYPGCSHYVEVRRGANPTTAHQQHCEDWHPGELQYPCEVVDDVEEIRRHVLPDLAPPRRCAACPKEFQADDSEEMISHLHAKLSEPAHRRSFFDIV